MNNIFIRNCRVLCGILFSFLSLSVSAQPTLTYTPVSITGLSLPVDMVNAGDGSNRLFIVEQGGIIKMYNGTTTSVFMNMSSVLTGINPSNDERGVLSMAFHPDYDGINNRFFYMYYTTLATVANITTIRIAQFETVAGNPNLGDFSTLQEVIAITKPAGRTNHNGGKLNFGADNMLYFATGDGGGGNDPDNLAQNGNSLLGKMIRIDINGTTGPGGHYSIPADNPYVSDGAIRDEIWALGLRNPFRWSFDPVTGAMWIGDVGQGAREEVNARFPSPTTGGVNYGWRCYEGFLQPTPGVTPCATVPDNYVPPVHDYMHDADGGTSITGGYVYRGSSPAIYGYYIFADYISNHVWIRSPSGVVTPQGNLTNVSAFATNEQGELYAVRRGGSVTLITSTSPVLPVTLVNFTGNAMGSFNQLRWVTAFEQNANRYVVEYSTDGFNYSVAGEVAASNNSNGATYSFDHTVINNGKLFYRLRVIDIDTSSKYSAVISIGGKNTGSIKLYPTIVQNNRIELTTSDPLEMLRIFDNAGRELYRQALNGRQGYFAVNLPALAKGIYFVQLQGKEITKTEKIVIR